MTESDYLSLEDALGMIQVLGIGPVRDIGLLDSALARPPSSVFGRDAYETLELKASALLHSLAKNHPLADGRERLSWLATVVFLRLDRHQPDLDTDSAFHLVLDVAGGSLELDEIARRLNVRATS